MKKSISLILSFCLMFCLFAPISSIKTCANADGIVVSNAGGTATTDNGGLILTKNLSRNSDGSFRIDLEAYTTGAVTTTTSSVPTDIVLVLDQSGSMANNISYATVNYNRITGNSLRNSTLYSNSSNLYAQDSAGKYCKVTLQREVTSSTPSGFWGTTYDYKYTYSYTPSNSSEPVIATTANNAANSNFDGFNLYKRTEGSSTITRLQALKDSVNQFLASISEKAKGADGILGTADDVEYRVAIVGYASGNDRNASGGKYCNTEILSTQNVVGYSSASNNDYKNALVSINSGSGINARLTTAVSRLAADGDTNSNLGIEMAGKVFAQNANESSAKVVVLFTDGNPCPGGTNDFDNTIANSSISGAKSLKDAGTSVYTVGILSNANPASPISTSDNTATGKINRYMHYVSSNFPGASNMSTPGAGGSIENGYYMLASSADSLQDIFISITNNIVTPTISLGSTVEVRDIISPYFDLPNGADASSVSVSTAASNGDSTWQAPVAAGLSAQVSGKTVSVTGFDFDENVVTTVDKGNGDFGKKLIISFNISFTEDSTFGGNAIPSNGANSGLYASGTCLCKFPVPTVDAPIVYDFDTEDQSIYLTNGANLKTLFAPAVVADGTNNKFVDIVYTVLDGEEEIGTYTIPAGYTTGIYSDGMNNSSALLDDKAYTVSCTVTPVSEGTYSAVNSAKDANVYVFVPEIAAIDDEVYLGDTVSIEDNTPLAGWVGNEDATAPTGTAPTLDFSYSAPGLVSSNAYAPEETSDVTTQIFIGTTDITTYCEGIKDFTVYVKTCDLTIVNPELPAIADEDQTFLYTVTGTKGNSYEVSIVGSETSKTIVGLPVDDYTVTCHADWSWNYESITSSVTGAISLTKDAPSATVAFFADYSDKWLYDESVKENVFIAVE